MVVAPDDTPLAAVETLLAEGLDLYGRDRVDEAIARWRQVLVLIPGEPRARDYLDAALPTPRVIPLRGDAPAPTLREQVQALVAEHRFEDALDALLAARAAAPDDEAISRSIRLVKERLMREYVERLGNLDRVPRASTGRIHPSSLGADAQATLRLVDGISSVDDILRASRLGQFRTLRTLLTLHERALIELSMAAPAVGSPAADDAVVDRVLADDTSAVHPVPPEAPPQAIRFAGPPSTPPPPDPHAALFAEATRAYLRRDYAAAEQLFERCAVLRPTDPRAHHNLESLRRRRSKPAP